jgi:hypothetical protein
LTGYVVKHFYVLSSGVRDVYLVKPDTGYWQAVVDLSNNLPGTTIPNCTVVVFALAYVVDDLPTPGYGPGVPTGPINTVVHSP